MADLSTDFVTHRRKWGLFDPTSDCEVVKSRLENALGTSAHHRQPKMSDDDWDTDPDFVNDVSEKQQRWGNKGHLRTWIHPL